MFSAGHGSNIAIGCNADRGDSSDRDQDLPFEFAARGEGHDETYRSGVVRQISSIASALSILVAKVICPVCVA